MKIDPVQKLSSLADSWATRSERDSDDDGREYFKSTTRRLPIPTRSQENNLVHGPYALLQYH